MRMHDCMKKARTLVCAFAALGAVALHGATADGGLVYSTAADFNIGEWSSRYNAIREKADADNVPLVAFWANPGCSMCKKLETALNTSEAYAWQKRLGCYFVFGYGTGSDDGKDCKKFAKGGNSEYPFIAVYWAQGLRGSAKTTKKNFVGRSGRMTVTSGSLANQFMKTVEHWLDGWDPSALYAGGMFAGGQETAGNRLEAEVGQSSISFSMSREATSAAANLVVLRAPDGAAVTNVVSWQVGQKEQTVTMDVSACTASAATLALQAVVADGDKVGMVMDERTVTVAANENASGNPLWIGERTADTLSFGEWTMDLDAATNKAAAADGAAYTLVAVSGSQWCPDCANTERNFLSVSDDAGENRFRAWAAAKNVALVTVDVPRFSANSVETAYPTLLSRSAYATTLARAKEYPQSGADAALTNSILRSGLGYLTRKGVSDEDALAVLERNRALVAKDGLLHSPLDASDFRTGVPIFVLLRKDGTVAARLTRFASASPLADARAKWDDVMKRFDEMLKIADGQPEEPANDYPGDGAAAFAANGGTAAGVLSHADAQDVFRLDGFSGNAVQKVTATGADGVRVTLAFLKLGADGKKAYVGAAATNALSETGFSIDHEFTEPGTYYVEVAADVADAAFDVYSPTADGFRPYSLSGAVVLVPQETRATASAPAGSKTVTMRLVKDALYRIQGLNVAAAADALQAQDASDPYCEFFTAKSGGDVELTCANEGGQVAYQLWNVGEVSFAETAKTVKENAGVVSVVVRRANGTSGAATVQVYVDEDATTLVNSDGERRYEFAPTTLSWAEGESGDKAVTVTVVDDQRFDGTGVLVLKLRKTDGAADVREDAAYALTVTDDDRQSAGKAAFVGVAEPSYYAKAKTVYVKEGTAPAVKVGRVTASDGPVTVRVKASPETAELGGDVGPDGVVAWGNHNADVKTVTVGGLVAGKTTTLTLANATDGLKILSSSNTVKVVAVAADAPEFEAPAALATVTRHVSSSNAYRVVSIPEYTKALKFTKLSGTLPAGLKATWGFAEKALVIQGVPTAKAGVYSSVYQVTADKTPGLTLALAITVVDMTKPGADGAEALNPAVAKTRTFANVSLCSLENTNRMAGVAKVTIPANGRVSAKLTTADGTTSFSARNWEMVDEDGTAAAVLTARNSEHALVVMANADGSAMVYAVSTLTEEAELAGYADGRQWSKSDTAADWKGLYTVALRHGKVTEYSDEGDAPRGHGCLTLKMTSSSAVNAGKTTWAGVLPNGTAVSGSAVLERDAEGDGEDCGNAYLPVFVRSSKDVLSAYLKVAKGAADKVASAESCQAVFGGCETYWTHEDAATDYEVVFDVYGGGYGTTYKLDEYYSANYLNAKSELVFDISGLGGRLYAGTPLEKIEPAAVEVKANGLALAKNPPNGEKLTFNRSTGIVTGTFKLPYVTAAGKSATATATYKGVMLIGWGPGCGCEDTGDSDVQLPFVSGAYWVSDKCESLTTGKPVSVKRGGAMEIGVP